MSPPLLCVEEGQSNASPVVSSASVNCISKTCTGLKERNYMGFSDCSSIDSSVGSSMPEEGEENLNLNLKATELRLGLPGSQSPEREPELCLSGSVNLDEKPLFSFLPSKDGVYSMPQSGVVSGNKRGFSETVEGLSDARNTGSADGKWMFCGTGSADCAQSVGKAKFTGNSGTDVMVSPWSSVTQPAHPKVTMKPIQQRAVAVKETCHNHTQPSNNNSAAPASKAQVVGWPPVRSFRKNSLAVTSKNNEEVDGKPGPGALLVKVSMDGAPYLRKVDLRNYSSYQDLSSALEKMFGCFTIGECGPKGAPGSEELSENKLKDILHGSEHVLTYEDKDGDWMLVGDIPWEMFIDSCKRLKIMKSSDAHGLAPRAMEKSKNQC